MSNTQVNHHGAFKAFTFSDVPVFIQYVTLIVPLIFLLTSGLHWFFASFVVYAIVLAHEFGHVFAARHYGITCKSILVTPMGGMADVNLEDDIGVVELLVALAGPAVNFVLAFIGIVLTLFYQSELIQEFIAINIVIGLFNLVPALPMDGGRVLRSILFLFLKKRSLATHISFHVSVIFSVLGVVLGLYILAHLLVLISVIIGIVAYINIRKAGGFFVFSHLL